VFRRALPAGSRWLAGASGCPCETLCFTERTPDRAILDGREHFFSPPRQSRGCPSGPHNRSADCSQNDVLTMSSSGPHRPRSVAHRTSSPAECQAFRAFPAMLGNIVLRIVAAAQDRTADRSAPRPRSLTWWAAPGPAMGERAIARPGVWALLCTAQTFGSTPGLWTEFAHRWRRVDLRSQPRVVVVSGLRSTGAPTPECQL
jgi:hypothetical protein